MTTDNRPDDPPETEIGLQDDEQPADGPEVTGTDDAAEEAVSGDEDGPNAEARRYRLRLRETEAERDRLAEHLEAIQRQMVEQVADQSGIRPQALWASGAQLDDLIADDGTIDADQVAAACERAADEFGLRQQVGTRVPHEGRHSGTPPRVTPQQQMVDVVMGNET